MGDRTWVNLTTQIEHKDFVHPLCEDNGYDSASEDEKFVIWEFTEVNYGDLDFLDKLIAQGIAFEAEWGQGSEYGSGIKHGRFTEIGEYLEKSIYNSDTGIQVDELMRFINDPAALRDLIEKRVEYLTILPWDNQIEYGKRYRVRQLISD